MVYIILYIISYTILYSSSYSSLLSYFPSNILFSSSPPPFVFPSNLSPPFQASLPFSSHLLLFHPPLPNLSPPIPLPPHLSLPSSDPFPHSKYTCRHLDILIYIPRHSSSIPFPILFRNTCRHLDILIYIGNPVWRGCSIFRAGVMCLIVWNSGCVSVSCWCLSI